VILVRALRALPLVQRRALVLHYLLDRSVADIAAETDTNVNTVKSWLARGRSGLAAVLGQQSETAHAHRGSTDGN
jgi:RNA polymerase sigma-70 factor (ECF subfamily)